MKCPKCQNEKLKIISHEEIYEERAQFTGKTIRKMENGWRKYTCGCGWESTKEITNYDITYEGNKKLVN